MKGQTLCGRSSLSTGTHIKVARLEKLRVMKGELSIYLNFLAHVVLYETSLCNHDLAILVGTGIGIVLKSKHLASYICIVCKVE